jgi:hypothetical protein
VLMSLLNFEVSVIALIDYSGSIMDEEEKVNPILARSYQASEFAVLS